MKKHSWNPDIFFVRVARLRQFHAAARLLEALFEDDGFSAWQLARPAGGTVELTMPGATCEDGRRIVTQVLATPAGGPTTQLLEARWWKDRDELTLRIHASTLALAAGADEDEARDAISSLVELCGLVTGQTPAPVMTVPDRSASEMMLAMARGYRTLVDVMTVADMDARAALARRAAALVTEHHHACERLCNEGDDDADSKAAAIGELEIQIAQVFADAGAPPPRFNRDPRGASVQVGDARRMAYLLHVPAGVVESGDTVPGEVPVKKPPRRGGRRATTAAAGAPPAVTDGENVLKERSIAPAVLEILRSSRLEADKLYLPANLDRKTYEAVDEAIRLAGGSWVGGRTRAHVFPAGPAQQALARMLATGQILDPKQYDFYPTPQEAAQEVVRIAGLQPGEIVGETSAGRGALALEAAKIVGVENVHTFELLPDHAQELRRLGFQVTEGDFLAQPAEPRFDAIVMNPPFGGMADMRHVEHSLRMLKPSGRLIAIVSPAFENRTGKLADNFRQLLALAGERIKDLPAGTFRESGTDVRTVIVRFEASLLPWNDGLAMADVERLPEPQRMRA